MPRTEPHGEANILSDAYRASYTVRPGTKPDSIHVRASEVAADSKVSVRIKGLQAQQEAQQYEGS